MRTDDPVILQQIEQLENVARSLRRICGFTPLGDHPDTTASRAPKWCPHGCNRGFRSQADLEHHILTEHRRVA